MLVNDLSIYDPFGWRIAVLADPSTDLPSRHDLLEAMAIHEAEEIALGRRHVTVVHGDPDTIEASARLTAFYKEVFETVAIAAAWARIRGSVDYVTVSVGGTGALDLVAEVTQLSLHSNPGEWRIIDGPFPSLH